MRREQAARANGTLVDANLALDTAESTPSVLESSEHVALREHDTQSLLVIPITEPAPAEVSLQTASPLTSRSSRDEMSLRTSVFSNRTTVTTKPSNDSVGSACLRASHAIDLRRKAFSCVTPSAAVYARRLMGLSILNPPASIPCDMAEGS